MRKVYALLFVLAAFCASTIEAQTISATTYPFSNSTGAVLEDLSVGATTLVGSSSDDGASPVTNIGFDFYFVGTRYSQFSANANGLVRLGATGVGTTFTNDLASSTNVPQIAPYWDDLATGTNGSVTYKVIGSAPNRKLVIQWFVTVPRNTTGAPNATFQCMLSETTSVIDFVYGSGLVVNSINTGYSVGIGSSSTVFASVTTTTPTVTYGTANNTQSSTIASGTKYTFTPPSVVTAPTGLNFTATTAVSTTLNWTDNATNEIGYAIYRSTDGINYNFISQTAANATSSTQTGLTANTTYFWKVYAVTEGGVSSSLDGSQTTGVAGNITSTGTGGLWSAGSTWSTGVVPTGGDNVTIANGATVTLDVAASTYSLMVNGNLVYEATTARALTVATDVTITAGAGIKSAATGTITTHSLSIGGNLANSGTIDFSTGATANTAGALLIFTGASNASWTSNTGSATNLRQTTGVTLNKGTNTSSTLTFTPDGTFTVLGANAVGFLTITNGMFILSGSNAFSNPLFNAVAYTIPATGGFQLNNTNATVVGLSGSPTMSGLLRITNGTFNIGSSTGNAMSGATTSSFIIEGGTINIAGRLLVSSAGAQFNMSAGTINVTTVGNASSGNAGFGFTSGTSIFTMSGGVINLVQRNTGATIVDYNVATSIPAITGGTLNVGTAATATNFNFGIQGNTPNVVIDNTTNAKTAQLSNTTLIRGSLTVNSGTTFNANGLAVQVFGSTVTNSGAIIGSTGSSRFDFAGATPQTYNGTGTFGTAAVPFQGVGVGIGNYSNVTLNAPIITTRVNLFGGQFINSNQITIGNGTLATCTIQRGGSTAASGSFDVAPVFNLASNQLTLLYSAATTAVTTGVEIPATMLATNVTNSNTNGVILSNPLTVAGILTLTTGNLAIGANTLTLNGTFASTGTGAITGGSSSNLSIGGTGALGALRFDQTTDGVTNILNNFTMNRTTSGTATLSNKLVILDTYTPTDGVLTTGGFLTLRSTSGKTARVASAGALTGYIIGDVSVERYIPSKRAYRLMNAPLTASNTINASWQNGGVYTPGIGTFITGTGTGFDGTSSSSPSLKTFNTATQALENATTTSVAVSANPGYFLFVRGDRNPANLMQPNTNVTTLNATGALMTGAITSTVVKKPGAAATFTLMGNPYMSPVNWTAVTKTLTEDRFTVWDPKLSGSNGVGGYVTFDASTGYMATVGGGSYTAGTPNTVVESSQAFFVESNSTTTDGSLGFAESNKVASNQNVFRQGNGTAEMLNVVLKVQQPDNSYAPADGVFAVYENAYFKAVTSEDAGKLDNFTENLSIVRENMKLAIEKRPLIDLSDTIYLKLESTTQRNYQFSVTPANFNAPLLNAYLEDTYTGTSTPLSLSAATDVSFSVNTDAASQNVNRFKIVFRTSGVLAVNYTSVKAYQQNAGVQVEWNIASETNTKNYEVEKSTDGRTFAKAATVTARANNNTSVSYNWFDATPINGVNYYRIKATENSNAVKVSQVVSVKIGNAKSEITVYPNPVTNNTMSLQFTNEAKGTYTVELFNSIGQQVYAKTIEHQGGSATQTLNLGSTVSKGIYQLQVTNGENKTTQQVVIN